MRMHIKPWVLIFFQKIQKRNVMRISRLCGSCGVAFGPKFFDGNS